MHKDLLLDLPALGAAQEALTVDSAPVAVMVVAVIFGTLLVALWLILRMLERRRRYQLLDKALQQGKLSPQAEAELVASLRPMNFRRLGFVVGWFLLLGSLAYLATDPSSGDIEATILSAGIGFALVSLPLAMRELESRKA